ncbi:lipopolysaccharide heptosyltransferase [Ectothiorhodospira haloalkaliphila]|uniref:Lipopolysaccharide heptosyltransferase n=1 Tax=Ectothiorhodospira haloalkaliphila TaxID=421628 RepID=W8KEF4_9GAMM|nr:glycosyltransferase family 9 protein [Ectothiorhodospira haloalkaliphila]AHK78114.1 lipopolysaccharide heptosyltransferase [Ectothiorhodospira haloalkaliphila]
MPSILIVRLSAIGDVVMASPLPAALRSRWPGASVTWVVEPQAAPLVARLPLVDRVVVWPKSQWRSWLQSFRWIRLGRDVIRLFRELRQDSPGLALDLQGLLKSGLLTRLSGARERVGLGSREGSHLLMTRVVPRGGDNRLIGSEYRHLAQELGLEVGDFRMRVGLSEADSQAAASVAQGHLRGYLVACPFTTRPQKHWVESYWAELAPRLWERYGMRLVLLGGPDDRAAADRIAARAGEAVDNRVGETSLTEAAAVIAGSRLMVGVDTGLTHMGPAFNVPTVALFGSTCPYLGTGRENTTVIYHDLPCAPCKRNPTCNGRFDCLTGITVDEVLTEVERLLPVKGASR